MMKQFASKMGLAVAAVLLCAGAHQGRADGVRWQTSWTKARNLSIAQGKPIMIDFYTDWCGWCTTLDNETYGDPRVTSLSRYFVPLKVNAERGGESLAGYFNVHSYPNVVFTASNGALLHRVDGFVPPQRFIAEMNYAYSRFAPMKTTAKERSEAARRAANEVSPQEIQARLDAAAEKSHQPDVILLQGTEINQDHDALLLVVPYPPQSKTVTKSKRVAVKKRTTWTRLASR